MQLLKVEPFALLGVNSDGDAEKLRGIIEKEGLHWRHAVDGTQRGPWATAWNVQGWPTLYLIDKDGVIRERDPRGERMKAAVLEVLRGKAGG